MRYLILRRWERGGTHPPGDWVAGRAFDTRAEADARIRIYREEEYFHREIKFCVVEVPA